MKAILILLVMLVPFVSFGQCQGFGNCISAKGGVFSTKGHDTTEVVQTVDSGLVLSTKPMSFNHKLFLPAKGSVGTVTIKSQFRVEGLGVIEKNNDSTGYTDNAFGLGIRIAGAWSTTNGDNSMVGIVILPGGFGGDTILGQLLLNLGNNHFSKMGINKADYSISLSSSIGGQGSLDVNIGKDTRNIRYTASNDDNSIQSGVTIDTLFTEIKTWSGSDTISVLQKGTFNEISDGSNPLFFVGRTTGVGINTNAPNTKAALDIQSTTKGFIKPRMTTTQRLAITSPPEGLEVWDLTLHQSESFNGTTWTP